MTKYEIEPFDWQYKLDQLSIALENKMAYVEVIGASFGDQLENREMQLINVSYDNNNDIIEIVFDQASHLIRSPLTISFQQDQDFLEAVEILDDNAENNTILFIEPFLVTNLG